MIELQKMESPKKSDQQIHQKEVKAGLWTLSPDTCHNNADNCDVMVTSRWPQLQQTIQTFIFLVYVCHILAGRQPCISSISRYSTQSECCYPRFPHFRNQELMNSKQVVRTENNQNVKVVSLFGLDTRGCSKIKTATIVCCKHSYRERRECKGCRGLQFSWTEFIPLVHNALEEFKKPNQLD